MLDFEEFTNGTVITESKGVAISVQERRGHRFVDGVAAVFDTVYANEDPDLQRSITKAPRQPRNRTRPTGLSATPIGGTPHLLIIQNTRRSPVGPDGRVTPNDHHSGGLLTLDFTSGYGADGVTLESLALAEVYNSSGRKDYLRLGFADGTSETFFFHDFIGKNRSVVFDVAAYYSAPGNEGSNDGVVTLELFTPNSGGIGNIAFTDYALSTGGLDDSLTAVPAPAGATLALAGLAALIGRRPA